MNREHPHVLFGQRSDRPLDLAGDVVEFQVAEDPPVLSDFQQCFGSVSRE
jgi:hypothetical protein